MSERSKRADPQRRRVVTGIAAFLAAVAIVVVVTERPGPETSGGGSGLIVAPGSTLVEPWSGRVWKAATGTWTIGRRNLRVVTPDVTSASILVTSAASSDYTVQAAIEQHAKGAGLVFRYVDPSNYWEVSAAPPQFTTWDVFRVVNGKRAQIGNLGELVCCDPRVLAISTERDGSIVFSIDGRPVRELTDPALADATATGVVATGAKATKAIVSNFEVIHRVPVISTTTTTGTG